MWNPDSIHQNKLEPVSDEDLCHCGEEAEHRCCCDCCPACERKCWDCASCSFHCHCLAGFQEKPERVEGTAGSIAVAILAATGVIWLVAEARNVLLWAADYYRGIKDALGRF